MTFPMGPRLVLRRHQKNERLVGLPRMSDGRNQQVKRVGNSHLHLRFSMPQAALQEQVLQLPQVCSSIFKSVSYDFFPAHAP